MKKNINNSFERYYLDPREEIVELVPNETKRVLDIGCGGGEVGCALKKRGVEFVSGVEINHEAAIYAREKLDEVIEGDIEKIELPFRERYFNCIVLADILEHLRDPWTLIDKLKRYLTDEGLVICSIPNIGHYIIIKNLLFHKWDYTKEGIMDKTHLRFFTFKSIKDMFTECGFEIVHLEFNFVANRIIRNLNKILFGILYKVFRHYFCEQYIFVAKKRRSVCTTL